MIIRLGDTQEIPGVGVFKWDGREFWIFGDVKYTHSAMYYMLKSMGEKFNVKNI